MAVLPDWFPSWGDEAYEQLMAQQDQLAEAFKLGSWPRFDYDLEQAALIFSEDGMPKVRAQIQVAGSVGSHDWLWSWANTSLPEICFSDVLNVRAFGAEHGIEILTSSSVGSDELSQLGWDLTAVAARVTGAIGAYRAPTKSGAIFSLIKSIGFVS